jgi:hypothetical protein
MLNQHGLHTTCTVECWHHFVAREICHGRLFPRNPASAVALASDYRVDILPRPSFAILTEQGQ